MKKHSIIEDQDDKISGVVENYCPVHLTMDVLSGKWTMTILWHLRHGVKRWGELKKEIVGITPAVLSAQLQSLVNEGILHRELYPEVPPKVEYSLTVTGKSLIGVIRTMEDWGIGYADKKKLHTNADCRWNSR